MPSSWVRGCLSGRVDLNRTALQASTDGEGEQASTDGEGEQRLVPTQCPVNPKRSSCGTSDLSTDYPDKIIAEPWAGVPDVWRL